MNKLFYIIIIVIVVIVIYVLKYTYIKNQSGGGIEFGNGFGGDDENNKMGDDYSIKNNSNIPYNTHKSTNKYVPYRMPYEFNRISKIIGTIPSTPLYSTNNTESRYMPEVWTNMSNMSKSTCVSDIGYNIIKGVNSKYIISPTYNDNVKPANTIELYNLATFDFNKQQNGGSVDDVAGGDGRIVNGLYSGDIINLSSLTGSIFQHSLDDNKVIMDNTTDTNLSKLRIISVNHNTNVLTPIKSGDIIKIAHNILYNNKNEIRYIKYGSRLQSHQIGQLYTEYKIYLQKDPKSQEQIKNGDHIILSCSSTTETANYIKLESDKSLSCTANLVDALVFVVNITDKFEYGDKQLCICPNDNKTLQP